MDLGKYFSGFFTHSLTRSVNENQNSFEDRESHFLIILKRNNEGDKIYEGLKESEEFNIYELSDLNNNRNLIHLVISLKFTNEKVSIKAEELQPSKDNNLFWGDWPPSYSWVFFLGNLLFEKISKFEFWQNTVVNMIALHNGESLFELFENSTKIFSINEIEGKKKETLDLCSLRVHENEQYSSIPRLFNIVCEWCDYFGPNIMTLFWLILVILIISMLILFINVLTKLFDFIVNLFVSHVNIGFRLNPLSKIITPYLVLLIPIITSIGLIFLKNILDDFPLPKHDQESLINFAKNLWRENTRKNFNENYLSTIYLMSIPILIISLFIPLSNHNSLLKKEIFQFIIHLFFSFLIFQLVNNLNIMIEVTRESYDTLWSLKLPLIIKNLIIFFYWSFIKQFSWYFYRNQIDYFPFSISIIIIIKNLVYIFYSIPFSKSTIGFKLGPKEEMRRIPLGDFIYYEEEVAINQMIIISKSLWNKLFSLKKRYTLYEDLWHYNFSNMILYSIYTEYPILSSLLLISNSFLTTLLLFSKMLTDSTRPWLLNITLSHQLWKFIIDSSILFSTSCFSSTPTSSNLKTFLFIITFLLNYVNIHSSKSSKLIYMSENLVFYLFKLVPMFKYTRKAIEKNKTSLNKAIDLVLRKRSSQMMNNQDETSTSYSLSRVRESGYSNLRPIELSSPLQELLGKFEGYWVLLRSNSDSLQEINAALGVSWFIRRAVDKLNPIVHYNVDRIRGIVSISTTLIMGLNNRTTLIINNTKNLGKNSFEEIENHRIEEFRMEEETNELSSRTQEESNSYRQFSNKRKKSLDKYLVIDQPSTTFEWSEDRTNIILETRQNREGFKMIETRSIIPSYKLPFKIKGNDGKPVENRHQDVLCYKVILKGRKGNSISSKHNFLVCCRYFIKSDMSKLSEGSNCSSKQSNCSLNKSINCKDFDSNLEFKGNQIDISNPTFLGEANDFPLTVGQLIQVEDEIFELVCEKRTELLNITRKLVNEIDNGSQKWTLERNSNGMRVYKREISGQPFMSCGITSILLNTQGSELKPLLKENIDQTNQITSIKDIVDYIWDSNNKMYYDPMVEKSDPMHYFKNDQNICIFYQAFKGQWGVSGRDFVVICYRYKPDASDNKLDESQYEYILTQSVEWPTINSSYVRAKNYFATYVFRPEGKNKVQAMYFNQVDLHTDISAWIIKRVILDQMNSLTLLRDILQKK